MGYIGQELVELGYVCLTIMVLIVLYPFVSRICERFIKIPKRDRIVNFSVYVSLVSSLVLFCVSIMFFIFYLTDNQENIFILEFLYHALGPILVIINLCAILNIKKDNLLILYLKKKKVRCKLELLEMEKKLTKLEQVKEEK